MKPGRTRIHRWIRIAFLIWAPLSTAYVANTMRTRGVPAATLATNATVAFVDTSAALELRPARPKGTALLFISGAGVAAPAYAPLLRPIADAGYPVFVIKLPWRFAPLESHKQEAIARVHATIAAHPGTSRWILAGHSLGAALATRIAGRDPALAGALVLIGTTHPRDVDLSALTIPITKVYGSNDGVAPTERMFANRRLLPAQTRWIAIEGGNHSQFGHYGHQLFDGKAVISRERQQAITRAALLDALTSGR